MTSMSARPHLRRPPVRLLIAAVCTLASLVACAPVFAAVRHTSKPSLASTLAAAPDNGGSGSQGTPSTPAGKPDATATVEQCLTSLVQSERSATFVGEMTAVPGTSRMEISIGLLERVAGETQYRSVTAAGLGSWRDSANGVKTYTYIKQVTNLAAPAFYRASVRFRWLGAKGHIIKAEEMRTPRCEQLAPPATTGSESSTTTTSSGTANTPSATATTPSGGVTSG